MALLGICTNDGAVVIVLEYLPGGALDSWLRMCGKDASSGQLAYILQQVNTNSQEVGCDSQANRSACAVGGMWNG